MSDEFSGFLLDKSLVATTSLSSATFRRTTIRRTRTGTLFKGALPGTWSSESPTRIEAESPQSLQNTSVIKDHFDTTSASLNVAASRNMLSPVHSWDEENVPVAEAVFVDFSRVAANRLEFAVKTPLMYKHLQHGADPSFDQLLGTMRAVMQHDLSAGCKRLLGWQQDQIQYTDTNPTIIDPYMQERCKIAIDFIFGRAMIEMLKPKSDDDEYQRLSDDTACELANMVLQKVRPKPGTQTLQADDRDFKKMIRLFAQLLSVVAQTQLQLVSTMFFSSIDRIDADPTEHVALIGSMSYAPLKLYPIQELEQAFKFLEECTKRLKQANGSKIRHAWAGLLVEKLTPIAAIVKSEVNLPICRKFVSEIYQYLLDLMKKNKHLTAILPLTTAVLSIAQKEMFVEKWPTVLNMCLVNLRNNKPALQEVTAECIVRLTWIYTVRNLTDSNQATKNRLKLISDAFFPKTQKLAPRQLPAKFFVSLLLYMAQGNFDFTMKVIESLLTIESNNKIGERVIIGVRGFLRIVNNLEINEGPPLAPLVFESLPSGHSVRPKTELLSTLLTRDIAQKLGLDSYLDSIQTQLLRLLQRLDLQIASVYIQTNPAVEAIEPLVRERARGLDVLRTCLLSVPRCFPLVGDSFDTIAILFRCSISIDQELCKIALTTLQNLILDRENLRELIIWHYTEFIIDRVAASFSVLTEDCLRTLLKFLCVWNRAIVALAATQQSNNNNNDNDTDTDTHDDTNNNNNTDTNTNINVNVNVGDDQHHHDDGLDQPTTGLVDARAAMLFTGRASPTQLESLRRPKSPKNQTTDNNNNNNNNSNSNNNNVARNRSDSKRRRSTWGTRDRVGSADKDTSKHKPPSAEALLYMVEGVALSSLFSSRPATRKICLLLLRQIRDLRKSLKIKLTDCSHVYDVIYDAVPDKYRDRSIELTDVQSFGEVGSEVLGDETEPPNNFGSLYALADVVSTSCKEDTWLSCVSEMLKARLIGVCNSALEYSWLCTCKRLSLVASVLGIRLRNSTKSRMHNFNFETHRESALKALMAITSAVSAQLPILLSIDDDSLASYPNPIGGEESFCHKRIFPAAEDYMRFVTSLLQSESSDIQNLALFSVQWIDHTAYGAFLHELQSLVSDCLSLRSESYKKKRKRDRLRIVVAQAHHRTSQIVDACLQDTKSKQILTYLGKYVTGTRSYLVLESENDSPDLDMLRLHFSMAVGALCRELRDLNLHSQLFTDEVRTDLFVLFSRWCEVSPAETTTTTTMTTTQSTVNNPVTMATRDVNLDILIPPGGQYAEYIRHHAVEAIAWLCKGAVFDRNRSISGGSPYLLKWLEGNLSSSEEEERTAAGLALLHLLEGNQDISVHSWAIHLCYTADSNAREKSFFAIVKLIEKAEVFSEHWVVDLCLAMHMLADDNECLHMEARRMLELLLQRNFAIQIGEAFPIIHSSPVQATRTEYQRIVGAYLAKTHPTMVLKMLPELFKRFLSANTFRQQHLVWCIAPWLNVLKLTEAATQHFLSGHNTVSAAQILLSNLIYLYARNNEAISLDSLWRCLLARPSNRQCVLEFLIFEGDRRGPKFLKYAQEVATAIATEDTKATVTILIEHITSMFRTEHSKTSLSQDDTTTKPTKPTTTTTTPPPTTTTPTTTNINTNTTIPITSGVPSASPSNNNNNNSNNSNNNNNNSNSNNNTTTNNNTTSGDGDDDGGGSESTFASHLRTDVRACCPELDAMFPPTHAHVMPMFSCSFWLLGEIIAQFPLFDWCEEMPKILHYACLGIDHADITIHARSKRLLLNLLLTSWSKLPTTPKELSRLVNHLRDSKASKLPASHERATTTTTTTTMMMMMGMTMTGTGGTYTEMDLDSFVLSLAATLDMIAPGVAKRWGVEAHACATACTACYYAGRSLQILRVFKSDLMDHGLNGLLVRLTNTVADNDYQIHKYASEILRTLGTLVEHGYTPTSPLAAAIPYIFWSAMAVLESDFEEEYMLAIRVLDRVQSTGHLDNPDNVVTLCHLLRQFQWENFNGVCVLLAKGVTSAVAGHHSLRLARLWHNLLGDPELNPHTQESFTLMMVMMLLNVVAEFELRSSVAVESAKIMSEVAAKQGCRLVSKIFLLYADNHYFRSKDTWIKELSKHFSKECFGVQEEIMLTLLVGVFDCGDAAFRSTVTSLLVQILPHVRQPGSFRLFKMKLVPAILSIVDQGNEDTSALVDAIAVACARDDDKVVGSKAGDVAVVCKAIQPRWERAHQCQERVRMRLHAILKTLGLINYSQSIALVSSSPLDPTGNISDTTSLPRSSMSFGDYDSHTLPMKQPSSTELRNNNSSNNSNNNNNSSNNNNTGGENQIEEERFFEDFDFLDDLVMEQSKSDTLNTAAADSDSDTGLNDSSRTQVRLNSLDDNNSQEGTRSRRSSGPVGFDLIDSKLLANTVALMEPTARVDDSDSDVDDRWHQRRAPSLDGDPRATAWFETDDEGFSTQKKLSGSVPAIDDARNYGSESSLSSHTNNSVSPHALTAANLKSLSMTSLASSTRSLNEDLPNNPAQDVIDQHVSFRDEAAYTYLCTHVDHLMLNNDIAAFKLIWKVARKAVTAIRRAHHTFVFEVLAPTINSAPRNPRLDDVHPLSDGKPTGVEVQVSKQATEHIVEMVEMEEMEIPMGLGELDVNESTATTTTSSTPVAMGVNELESPAPPTRRDSDSPDPGKSVKSERTATGGEDDTCVMDHAEDEALLSSVQRAAETLAREPVLPYVYMDARAINRGRIVDTACMLTLELSNDIRTYIDEKEKCVGLLVQIDQENFTASANARCEAMLSATRLNLQLSKIMGGYVNLVGATSGMVTDVRVQNLSVTLGDDLNRIQQEMMLVQEKRLDTSGLSKLLAVQYLMDNLRKKRSKSIAEAIALLRVFRKSWPGDVFGHSDADDADVLINICAASACVEGSQCVAVICPEPSVAELRVRVSATLVHDYKVALCRANNNNSRN